MPKAIAGGDKPAGDDVIRVFFGVLGRLGSSGLGVFGFRVKGLETFRGFRV